MKNKKSQHSEAKTNGITYYWMYQLKICVQGNPVIGTPYLELIGHKLFALLSIWLDIIALQR
jgi:hypothetical protein